MQPDVDALADAFAQHDLEYTSVQSCTDGVGPVRNLRKARRDQNQLENQRRLRAAASADARNMRSGSSSRSSSRNGQPSPSPAVTAPVRPTATRPPVDPRQMPRDPVLESSRPVVPPPVLNQWVSWRSFNLTRNGARHKQINMRAKNTHERIARLQPPLSIPQPRDHPYRGLLKPARPHTAQNPVRDPETTQLLNQRRWEVEFPAAQFQTDDQSAKSASEAWGRGATEGGSDDWMTVQMRACEDAHLELAKTNQYFTAPWDRGTLFRIWKDDTGENDQLMAKFLVRLHLKALKEISDRAHKSDKRVDMLNCFDLASLHANVEHLWKYRRIVFYAKRLHTQDLQETDGKTNRKTEHENNFKRGTTAPPSVDGIIGSMFMQDTARKERGEYLEANGYPDFEGLEAAVDAAQEALRKASRTEKRAARAELGRLTEAQHAAHGFYAWQNPYPSPPMLPGIVCGPPRQGKSAMICLLSGFVVKLGGTVMLGLGPNKTIPFAEMLSKYVDKLQWTPYSQEEAKRMQTAADLAAQPVPPTATTPPAELGSRRPLQKHDDREGTEKARTTTQGLEIATMWGTTSRVRVVRCGEVPQGTLTRTPALTPNQFRTQSTNADDQPVIIPVTDAQGNDVPPFTVWRRSYATGHPEFAKLKTGGEWEEARACARLPTNTQHFAGSFEDTMQMPRRVNIYVYSETVAADVKSAADVIDAIYDDMNEETFCVSIHDECQTAFGRSTDGQIQRVNDRGTPLFHFNGKPQTMNIKEDTPGWKRPKPVLYHHRRAYPLVRNLKFLVSATVIPALMEQELFGTIRIPPFTRPMPRDTQADNPAAWIDWHEAWDVHLMSAANADVTFGTFAPRMCPMLLPPRGRLFYAAAPDDRLVDERNKVLPRLPEFVRAANPSNPNQGGWPTYYGTMEHFQPCDNVELVFGWNPSRCTQKQSNRRDLYQKALSIERGGRSVLNGARDRLAPNNDGDGMESGVGNFTSPGMWHIDLSQNPSSDSKGVLLRRQTQYTRTRQQVEALVLVPGNPTILAPYRRATTIPVDYPSPEFIKAMMLVTEWLYDRSSLFEREQMYDYIPQLGDDDYKADHSNRIVRTFFPMFVMAPTRAQKNEEGILDWAIHSIKQAWYLMHYDFTRSSRPAFVETQGNPISSDESHQGEREPSVFDLDPNSRSQSKYASHPHRTCMNLRQFRAKYGMTVLIYGSSLNAEQRRRVMTDAGDPESEFSEDDRIISVTFDPAHPQNRLAVYGDPSPRWECFEEDANRRMQLVEWRFEVTFILQATKDQVEDENVHLISYALRNVLPVSPEGVNISLFETASNPEAPLTNLYIVFTVPGSEVEEFKTVFKTGILSSDRSATTALNLGIAVESVVGPNPLDREEDMEPREVYTSTGYRRVGPRIARGNMIPEGDAHRVETMPGQDGFVTSVLDVPHKYVFDPSLSHEDRPRLPYVPDFQGPQQPIDSPLEDLNGIVPKVAIQSWTDAQTAVQHFERHYGIVQVMAAGYNMFQAGTTLQVSSPGNTRYAPNHPDGVLEGITYEGPTDLNWIPKYMALATTETPSIDATYQMLGRCFVDLGADSQNRPIFLPKGWKVYLLGIRELIPAVDLYSKLELRFSQLEGMTLTGAVAHLAQFLKSEHTELKDPSAIALMLRFSLGVENRTAGLHEFFKMEWGPAPDRLDPVRLAPIPPRNPDPGASQGVSTCNVVA